MAWFQDLAGKAEDLLNKIDQNAANVFDATSQPKQKFENSLNLRKEDATVFASVNHRMGTTRRRSSEDVNKLEMWRMKDLEGTEFPSDLTPNEDSFDTRIMFFGDNPQLDVYSGSIKESSSSETLKNDSLQDGRTSEMKVATLESQMEELNKHLLNLQHNYNQLNTENVRLMNLLKKTQQNLTATQSELEKYRLRAQKVLQEKEKLLALRDEPLPGPSADNSALQLTNETLREELMMQEAINVELHERLEILTGEFDALQSRFVSMDIASQKGLSNLQRLLVNEQKLHEISKEELKNTLRELERLKHENLQLSDQILWKTKELQHAKEQYLNYSPQKNSEELKSRLKYLNELLLRNQTTLETITTERNALKLQLEKLETEYHIATNRLNSINSNNSHCTINMDDVNDSPQMGLVTRRFKNAYNAVNMASVRTGQFLKRYPVIRSFLFLYIVLLHLWVIVILSFYIPSL